MNSVEVLTQKVEDSKKEIDKKNSEIKDLTSSIETRSQKVEVHMWESLGAVRKE